MASGRATNTLCRRYTPRFLQDKKPEATIITKNQGQTPTSHDQTAAWYHSLGETEKQIKGAQLHSHETSGYSPFVILAMNDNSFMLLEVSPGEVRKDSQSVDVIRLTESELKDLSPGSIHVDFFQTPNNPDAVVNLRLVIAICQEFIAHISSSDIDINKNKNVCSRLFAITLFVSVVRQHLPVNNHLIESIRTIDAVDGLWADILSQDFVGQMLWENRIIGTMHRTMITATRGQVDDNYTDLSQHCVKVTIAWLESTVHPRKPCISKVWDTEWGLAWDVAWENNWKEAWANLTNYHHFDIVRAPLMAHDQLPLANTVLGRAAGRAAGRAMIELELVSNSIESGVTESALGTSEDPQTRGLGICSTVPDHDVQPISIPPPVEGTSTDTYLKGRPTIAHQRSSWFESWYSMRRPDSKLPDKWLPVWEAARHLAWTLEWANHPEQRVDVPQAIAPPVQVINSQSPDEAHPPSHPSPQSRPPLYSQSRRDSTARSPWVRIQDAINVNGRWKQLIMSPQGADASIPKKKLEPDLETLSEIAWNKAYNSDPSLDQYINNQGAKICKILQTEIDTNFQNATFLSWRTQPLPEQAVIEILRTSLEKTWRASWERAWNGIMEEVSRELKHWMPADSEDIDPSILIDNVRELKHYTNLSDYMKSGNSKEENYWHIRSAFKALNLLHRFMAHSVPLCYEGAMEINRYEDKSYDSKYSISGPNPKNQKIIKSSQEYKEVPISMTHTALQDTMKRLAWKATESLSNYDPVKSMEKIWNKARGASVDPKFMNNNPEMHWSEQKNQVKSYLHSKHLRARWNKIAMSALGASKSNTRGPTQTQPTGATPSGTQENGNSKVLVVRQAGLHRA